MGHSADEPAPAPASTQDPWLLKSVLVVFGDELDNISDTDVMKYMETKESGGGPVYRVDKRDHFTYTVDFLDHKDAVNVVRKDHRSMKGFSARVFLFDEQNMTVYSRHQTVSSPDEEKKRVLRAPTTVLLHGHIFYKWDFTADDIKARMEHLGNKGCRVNSDQCPDRAGIAFVEFERTEDALKVVNKEEVTLPAGDNEWPVSVFLWRPLPSDPAAAHNTTDTAMDGMPASTVRVGQTQGLEGNQAPGAPVTKPHDSRTMQASITSGTSRAEGKFQKEKDRVQDQTEKLRRVEDQTDHVLPMNDQTETVRDNCEEVPRVHDQKEGRRRMQDRWGEALRRTTDETEKLRRAKKPETRAKMQSNMLSLEARLQSAVTQPQARLRSTVSQLEKDVRSGFTNVEDQVSRLKSHFNQLEVVITQLSDDMAQLRDDLNASELAEERRDTKMTTKSTPSRTDLKDPWQACHDAHLKGNWSFGPPIGGVSSKHQENTLWWKPKMLY